MARSAVARMSAVLLVMAVAMTLLVAVAPAASAAPVRPAAESRMIKRINEARTNAGLSALRENLQMVRLAREWARRMASERRIYHRPNLADVVDGDYVRLAENVGYTRLEGASDGELVRRLHKAFMASTSHRAQIMGRFNQVGVGIYRAPGGQMYVAVNFIKGPRDGFPLYRDAENSPHRGAIAKLFRRGAVSGCARNRFCPGATGSRAYLAATLDRAAHMRAARNYLASTCSTSFTCRSADLTRGEMAVIIAESLNLAPVSGRQFTDVSTRQRSMINAVVKAGIMSGCSATRFCPGREVSRGRIAKTVYRTVTR
jgi:uncharacterized protein YkwD